MVNINKIKQHNGKYIGIMTWYNHGNCGGNLQAYAMKNILNNLGYKVKFIYYTGKVRPWFIIVKRKIRRFISKCFKNCKTWGFDSFQVNYLPETFPVNETHLKKMNDKFDMFLCGSDQIWTSALFDKSYFLDFVSVDKKKIAYGPSIGLSYIPESLQQTYRQLVNRINFVSVREETAQKMLKDICYIDSCTVLDPTLLLDINEYQCLEEQINFESPFIFCYFLNQNNWYCEIVKKIASIYKCNLVVYSLDKKNKEIATKWIELIYPELFLSLIHNSKAVITDSYHGTIFSIIYHKPFVNLIRFMENDPICQNSRVYDLLSKLELRDRIIKKDTQESALKIFNEIDYGKIDTILLGYKQESLEFLKNALN